jgi:hypothetical protein
MSGEGKVCGEIRCGYDLAPAAVHTELARAGKEVFDS